MNFLIARAQKHMWEEPIISGLRGSGTIFFTGCMLKCVYCQNFEISHNGKGIRLTQEQLICLMLSLQDEGVHNINLVTPSHYVRQLSQLLEKAKKGNLKIPIVYNCGGYDKVTDLVRLEGLVDIYLPDIKYFASNISLKYSGVADYFDVASKALIEMRRQQPKEIFSKGMLKQGVVVRHLVLPNNTVDSLKVLDFIAKTDKNLYVSVMAQYFPTANAEKFPELSRRLNAEEYNLVCQYFFNIGLKNGYVQDLDSAIKDYVPEFDLDKLMSDVIKAERKFGADQA